MPLALARIADEVGVVLSGASAAYAPVAIRRDVETKVREEDLTVIVDDRLDGYYILGVLRWVTRYDPFLRRGVHNVYVENPDALTQEMVLPFTNALVEIYGGLCEEPRVCGSRGFVANTYAPTPGSRVFRLRDATPLAQYFAVEDPVYIGVHKYSGWRLPLDPGYLPYHVGVFGATGMGKSRLVAKLASEAARAGYAVIVFDHSGVDYVPSARRSGVPVVDASRIRVDPFTLAETIMEAMGVSSYHRDLVELASVCYILDVYGRAAAECEEIYREAQAVLRQVQRRNSGESDEYTVFASYLAAAGKILGARRGTIEKFRLLARMRVSRALLAGLRERDVEPSALVEEARHSGVVVVDLSSERSLGVKRAIIASVAESVWSTISETLKPARVGLVVDEAQNYACEHCGVSSRALETVAREGRKWGFFVVLASQRVARDVKASIRSNLGTVFFSKLQSTGDLQEIAGYLDLGRLTESSLAMLSRREFYVAGLMNPLRRPLLLRVDETAGLEPPRRAGG